MGIFGCCSLLRWGPLVGLVSMINSRERQKHLITFFLITLIFVCLSLGWVAFYFLVLEDEKDSRELGGENEGYHTHIRLL